MHRSCAACVAILATLRAETAAIRADSAFSEAQRDELNATAKSLASECEAVRTEASVTIERLTSASKELSRWKKIYKSYSDLGGEKQAKEVIKIAVNEFVKQLTAKPATPGSTPPAK